MKLSQGGTWMRAWAARIEPLRFSFLGGEPLLNDELPEYLSLGRQLWPHAALRLVTNGLLFGRWGSDCWQALQKTETLVTISIHSQEPRYLTRLERALTVAREQAQRFGVHLELRDSIRGWYRLYRGEGPAMVPFADGDARTSWTVCQSKHCVTLQENALWKCPPAAHLPRLATQFALGEKEEWRIPLSYQPLTLAATDDDLRRFFAQREEPICGMCPARLEYFEKSIY